MASEPSTSAGFSAQRRWSILLSVIVSVIAVAALVVMVNFEAARHPRRFYWSSQSQTKVSPKTAGLLHSLTNQIKVIVYYDRTHEPLYSSICALLDEYRLINPGISVEKVDYVRNPTAALRVKTYYKLNSAEDKDLVIFDCEGHGRQIVPGDVLGDFSMSMEDKKGEDRQFVKHLKGFKGDMIFSALILGVTNPRVLTAGFLDGHGAHPLDGTGEQGYQEFKQILQQNWIQPSPLSLLGPNPLSPTNCNLLVIAGPTTPLLPEELLKVKQYLAQGGRLLMLFNPEGRFRDNGLVSLMADWGVRVSNNRIVDKEHSSDKDGYALVIQNVAKNHPAVSSLAELGLFLVLPRPVGRLNATNQSPGTPKVEELAFTSDRATTTVLGPASGPISVMASVEKAGVKGDLAEFGTTRILVVGESLFLDNQEIDYAGNRDFAANAVNWLLEQNQLLQGTGPQVLKEYKLMMTRSQLTSICWLFLAGMPGAILFLGGLVWLRRRH